MIPLRLLPLSRNGQTITLARGPSARGWNVQRGTLRSHDVCCQRPCIGGGIRSAFMVFDSDGSNGVTLRESRPADRDHEHNMNRRNSDGAAWDTSAARVDW